MNDQQPARNKGPGCLGMGARIVAILLLLLLVIGVLGALFEAWRGNNVAQDFPAPGQIVEVDGRAMHIECMGEGSPVVLLDAGQGGWSTDWSAIMPQIGESTRVCAYDRAGYGWSDPARDDRSPQDLAEDLQALLAAAQIEPPWLLVGYSHAGLHSRIFAAQNASDLAGMVLIDPATEFDNEILGPELLQQQRSAVGLFNGLGFAARLGLVRLLDPESMAGSAPFIGTKPANPDLYYTFVADPQWWQTSVREFTSHLNDEHLAMVRAQGAIPDIPLIVIASDVLDSAGNPALAEVQSARQAMLQELAAQSPQGEYIMAEGSTHDILADRPDVVIEAITTLVESARSATGGGG